MGNLDSNIAITFFLKNGKRTCQKSLGYKVLRKTKVRFLILADL